MDLNYPEQSDTVNDGDFLAVYDKTMLDRAKEYCNDNDIADWTRFGIENQDGEIEYTEITNAVAYTWGGTDTVENFNRKMAAQRNALTAYYAKGQSTTIAPNPAPTDHPDWSPWEVTTAPGSNWNNYLFTGNVDTDESYGPLELSETEYFPYRPGFSIYRYLDDTYNYLHVLPSAGIDCSGFVQRVAGYPGNPYSLVDFVGDDAWGDGTNANGMPVLARHGTVGIDDRSWLIENENLIVPGDILMNRGNHVSIVLNVGFSSASTRIINKNLVHVIEASGWMNYYKVTTTQTWENWGGDYFSKRLSTN